MTSIPRFGLLLAVAGSCLLAGCAIGFPKDPTSVTPTGATLNADVYTSFGGQVTYWFRYGLTSGYGAETPHRTISLAEGTGQPVSEGISGLTAGREYHWQVCAQDEEEQPARIICSADKTFRTFVELAASCGQTITQSVRLTNDLQNCSGHGLVIGANNITLDLNGHTIDGDLAFGGGDGIRNAGFDGVWIENGTVREFSGSAVALSDAAGNRVRELSIQGENSNGIDVAGDSTSTLIADNQVSATRIALRVSASGIHVEGNEVSGIGLTAGGKLGPLVVFGDDNRIEGNTARLTHVDGVGTGVGRGSVLVFGDRNEVVGNTASDGVLNGIVVDVQASETLVSGNLAENNGHEFSFGDGILAENASTSLGDNTANSNDDLGINAVAGVTDLGGNQAQGNGNPLQCQNVSCE